VDRETLIQPLRVLRLCLHLLVVALLALAAVRALADHLPHAAAVVVVAVLLVGVYTAGPLLPAVRRSRTAAGVWLAVLSAGWLVLLALTPDGVWLAFPLFLLQLHLLGARSGVPAVAATTVAAVGGFAWHQGELAPGAVIGPVLGAAVAVATVLGYQALHRESEQRRRLIDELTATQEELAAAERSAGVLAERERLSVEIHDTVAQGLASIQLLLRAAEAVLPDQPEVAGRHVEQARRTAQENLAEARRLVQDLAPSDLAGASLSQALDSLCARTTERSSLIARFHLDGEPAPLTTTHEAALLRIAQAALANTATHADATHVDVTLTYLETGVALDVVDDGIGFDPLAVAPPGASSGYGLAAMRARAQAAGGTLSVESSPGQGTAVAVSLVAAPPATVGA